MAVSVSRDLTVQVLEDVNAVKLSDRQQALRAAIQKGEPKCLGVSQVMLGLMVISYSIPLHVTEITEVIHLGVPWWSGLTFITAGVTAIILDRNGSIKTLRVCLLVSLVSAVLSVVAVIIYSVDMNRNSPGTCDKTPSSRCSMKYYTMNMSRGVKTSLLLFTLAQMVISSVVCFLLFRQRSSFRQYTSLSDAAPSTPTSVSPPDLN
ncbi:transmembrane protein 176 [Notolabrus celidotus]|uniref:transmembrane protein 176 n=1 Tax=Notolabrus celidotus TaxID=1203425 RepID=UPI00148FF594|nr:transmembrane protein 176 [Notolabrus celidotus]